MSLVVWFPGVEYLLALVPILSILAPFLVFRGTDIRGPGAPGAASAT